MSICFLIEQKICCFGKKDSPKCSDWSSYDTFRCHFCPACNLDWREPTMQFVVTLLNTYSSTGLLWSPICETIKGFPYHLLQSPTYNLKGMHNRFQVACGHLCIIYCCPVKSFFPCPRSLWHNQYNFCCVSLLG